MARHRNKSVPCRRVRLRIGFGPGSACNGHGCAGATGSARFAL